MKVRLHQTRAWLACIAALSLVNTTSAQLLTQTPVPPPSKGEPQVSTNKVATTTNPVDEGWPRAYKTPSGGSILLYQPQVASWEGQQHLTGYAAVAYVANEETKPALGIIKIEAESIVAVEDRLVRFSPLKITESNFSTLPKDQTREVVAEIDKAIPDEERVIALDRMLAFVDASKIIPRPVDGIKADPPKIFFSQRPAVLINFDGDPIWSPIKENDLKFAVNTNWDLFQHTPTNTFYLRHDNTWLKAADIKGPWGPAGNLPESFSKLPAEENWNEIKANVPGTSLTADKVPSTFVNFQPSELILLDGAPKYAPVTGTQLLWVSNTDSDLFRLGASGAVYYLVAGRWFSAPNFTGPWTFVTQNLPADFKKIPLEHPRSRVLASVPGTQQAAEAVLLAQVPRTARVNKKELKAPEVSYQGEPQFQAIDKTTVLRAVNTDKDILKVGELYYMCFQGVWFTAQGANGPWAVADSVPKEIYEIPASSPAHSVTYVVEEKDDDENDDWVNYAYYAGYTGMMIGWGCAVWGTGWYYPPYIGYGGYYPVYYPYWHTYGAAAWYNPYTGAFGRAGGIYGPFGGVTFAARYNPTTGTYARGAVAYGPSGARGFAQAYNPRTGAYAQTRQGSNIYGSWGSTFVKRGDDWAQTRRYTNRVTGDTTRVTRTDNGAIISRRGDDGRGFVAAGEGGNVYAGKDGNVYRRGEDGNWNKYENGSWNPVSKPDGGNPSQQPSAKTKDKVKNSRESSGKAKQLDRSTYGQLEHDRSARKNGSDRTRDYGNYQNRAGSSSRNMGSYRGGGGGRMGGGFGRR